jgi:hypothetical protein
MIRVIRGSVNDPRDPRFVNDPRDPRRRMARTAVKKNQLG